MTESFEYVGPLPPKPAPTAALLGEEARRLVAALLREMGYGAPVSLADVAVSSLDPLVAALVAEQRKAERRKVADLLAEHAETLAAFAGDKADLVGLLTLLLRLDTEPAS